MLLVKQIKQTISSDWYYMWFRNALNKIFVADCKQSIIDEVVVLFLPKVLDCNNGIYNRINKYPQKHNSKITFSEKLTKKIGLFAMFGFVVPEILRFQNQRKSLKMLSQHFFWCLNLHISGTTHPNIANHTFFVISFSSSFYLCYSFSILRNIKNWYFSLVYTQVWMGKINLLCILGNYCSVGRFFLCCCAIWLNRKRKQIKYCNLFTV